MIRCREPSGFGSRSGSLSQKTSEYSRMNASWSLAASEGSIIGFVVLMTLGKCWISFIAEVKVVSLVSFVRFKYQVYSRML